MKRRNKAILAAIIFSAAGCVQQPAAAQPPIRTPETATEDTAMTARTLTKEEAQTKAVELVAGKNWGPPTSVTEEGKNYVVYFATSNKERALLSQRAIIVNKETGAARFRPRR